MIKKISAVLIALVLCLSVVILPVSAYSLPETMRVGYEIKLDKKSYNPGDIVTVSVYLHGDSGVQFHTGSMAFGVNNAVFDTTTTGPNAANKVKATAKGNDTYDSFYNPANTLVWSWQAATIKTKISEKNTAEENAKYNEYLKVVYSRNTAASHPNAWDSKSGLPADDVEADSAPFLTFQLKIRDDVAPGTPVNIGIPTGCIMGVPAQTAFKVYLDGSTGNVSLPVTQYDVVTAGNVKDTAVAAATILDHAKHQIRFQTNDAGKYNDAFDIRYLAKIDNATFLKTFGSEADAKNMIHEIGFVYAKFKAKDGTVNSVIDMDTVKSMVEKDGAAPSGYAIQVVDYLSNSVVSGAYAFQCIVTDIPDAEQATNGLHAVGYIKYADKDGKEHVDYYASGVVSEPFADIYGRNENNIPR